ncbi:uncharacterized protein LOC126184517 isoform X2 [Schistocerca cancellata]|uniref:uncharacterized protein LOC126184517 isoform X2 n=1 Tax=Schistocerca cancellata TaxID=274614 RepID=UPI002118CAAF|nr:uncharacterized protein LOC126184517 isoform X2 [Schistocerca cancellata]
MNVTSGSSKAGSHNLDERSQCRVDGSSSPGSRVPASYPPQVATTAYYGGPPLWYYSSQTGNNGKRWMTRCSDKDGWRPTSAPQISHATLQQVQGSHTGSPPEDYNRQLQFVGLQVADTAVEVPRLHGAVWGHQTHTTGVGPMEHHEENGIRAPYLVPTAQAVWITNRHLPKGPDTVTTSAAHHQSSEHSQYMAFAPTENKPLGTVPIKFTNVNGRQDVLHLPIMPHLLLQSLPGSSSTYMFHHVAWLFWPASGQDTSNIQCSQTQMAPRHTN